MKPRVLALTVALSCVIGVAGSKMCLADDGVSAKYVQTAEQAMQQQQYKKAELNWTKAIKLIETQEDDNLARALTGLTTAYRQQGKINALVNHDRTNTRQCRTDTGTGKPIF